MANRFVLNETSYHGVGAINEIAGEAKGRNFTKAFVCSDPDLVKFGVTAKVLRSFLMSFIPISNPIPPLKMCSPVWRRTKNPGRITSSLLVAAHPWIPLRRWASLSTIPTLQM